MGDPVTVDVCERFHREVCERIDGVDAKLDRIAEAELAQAASLERTQAHLEGAAKELEQAAKTINAQTKVQDWMQGEITATRATVSKENWRLIGVMVIVLIALLGLKASGISI